MASRFRYRSPEIASFLAAVAIGPIFVIFLQLPDIAGALEYVFGCLLVLPLVTALAVRSPFVVWQISVLSVTASMVLEIFFRGPGPQGFLDLPKHALVIWFVTTVLSSWFPVYFWLFAYKTQHTNVGQ
jgi:hypothetical protein